MPTRKDNLRRWREAAEIDWFSQFIKAWIPFNAWMTDSFGDLSDRESLDRVKEGSNFVFNRIVPMLNPAKERSQDAEEFRLQVVEPHRLLQGCMVAGRKGRVWFEEVDIGENKHADEKQHAWKRDFRVRRNQPG